MNTETKDKISSLLEKASKKIILNNTPHDYASVKMNVIQLEFSQEIKKLQELLLDSDNFEEEFKQRCSDREQGKVPSIPFSEMPESITNQLYWDIALTFNPKNLAEILAIVVPNTTTQLNVSPPEYKFSPKGLGVKERGEYLKKIPPILKKSNSLEALTQSPHIKELNHYIMKKGLLFDLRDIRNFPLNLHANLQELLNELYPELVKPLYSHNNDLQTLESDILIFNNGLTPKTMIEQFIRNATLGGSRITGLEEAGKSAQAAVQRFYSYFEKQLPVETKEKLRALKYNYNSTLGDIIDKEIKKGECVETTSLNFKALLDNNNKNTVLNTPPTMTLKDINKLEKKYKKEIRPSIREMVQELYDSLTNIRESLMGNLLDVGANKKTSDAITQFLNYFNQLPEKIRNDLLAIKDFKQINFEILSNKLKNTSEEISTEDLKIIKDLATFLESNTKNLLLDYTSNDVILTERESLVEPHLPLELVKKTIYSIAPQTHEDLINLLLNFPPSFYNVLWRDIILRNPLSEFEDLAITIASDIFNTEQREGLAKAIAEHFKRFNLNKSFLSWSIETNDTLFLKEAIDLCSNNQTILFKKIYFKGQSLLHEAAQYPESLKYLLQLVPNKEKLNTLDAINKYGNKVIHKAATHPECLKIILSLYPIEQRLDCLLEENYREKNIFDIAAECPQSLKVILELLPKEQRVEAVKLGCKMLFEGAEYAELLKDILELIPEEHRYEIIANTDSEGNTLLHEVAIYPESLKVLLSFLTEEQKFKLVNLANEEGNTPLHESTKSPDSLNILLSLYLENEKLKAIKVANDFGKTVVDLAATYPKSLQTLLAVVPEEDILDTLLTTNKEGNNLFHQAASNLEALNYLLEYVPKKNKLDALMTTNKFGNTVLHLVVNMCVATWLGQVNKSYPELLKALMNYVPQEQYFDVLVLSPNDGGDSILHNATSTPDSFDFLMEFIPKERQFDAIITVNNLGNTLLHQAAINQGSSKHPESESLFTLLALMTKEQGQEAVKIINKEGQSILHLATNNAKSLMLLLDFYSKEERLDALKATDNLKNTVFHMAVNTPGSMKLLLKFYSEEDRLGILLQTNKANKTVLAEINSPETLITVLELLPQSQRFAAIKAAQRALFKSLDSIDNLLQLLPEDQIQDVLKLTELNGSNLLHHVASDSSNALLALMNYLPNEQKRKEIKVVNKAGENMLHLALKDLKSLEYLLGFYSKEERWEALKIPDKLQNTVLHLAAKKPKSLQYLLGNFPEECRLEALLKVNQENKSVFKVMHPVSLIVALELLPKNQRFEALKAAPKAFYKSLDDADNLEKILNLLPEEQITDLVNLIDPKGNNLLHYAVQRPRSLNTLINFCSKDVLSDAVKIPNLKGNLPLHLAGSYPESLGLLLNLYPEEQRLKTLKETNDEGRNVFYYAAHSLRNKEILETILAFLPEEDRLECLRIHVKGQSVLTILIKKINQISWLSEQFKDSFLPDFLTVCSIISEHTKLSTQKNQVFFNLTIEKECSNLIATIKKQSTFGDIKKCLINFFTNYADSNLSKEIIKRLELTNNGGIDSLMQKWNIEKLNTIENMFDFN